MRSKLRTRKFDSVKRLGLGLACAVLASILISPSPAAVASDPVVTTINCPDGGWYQVDANGVALNGGQRPYTDANGTVLAAGNCTGALTIDASVKSIGDYAFIDSPITSLTIPSSVTTIGTGSFGDILITSLTIPDSVTSVGRASFSGASSLASVQFGSGVTAIGSGAFRSAPLTAITLPASVTSIGGNAFADSPLNSITFNSSTLTIGVNAFHSSVASCFNNLGHADLSASLSTSGLPADCAGSSTPSPTPTPTPTPSSTSTVSAPVTPSEPATPVAVSTPTATPTPSPTPIATPSSGPVVIASPQPNPSSDGVNTTAAAVKVLVAGFAPGSAALNSATKQAVTKLKPSLANATKIVIVGLTTGSSSSAANQALANRRALSARAYIQALVGTKVRIVIASPKIASTATARVRGVQISVHS